MSSPSAEVASHCPIVLYSPMMKHSPETTHGRVRTLAALLAGTYAVSLAYVWRYFPFFEDDAFISLRYAKRLISGHGLTWTDGPPIEGYTNFLWTILCAGLGFLGMDLVFAARLLGVLCLAGLFAAIGYRFRRATTADLIGAATSAAIIAFSGSIAAWTIGGLEMPLYAMLLLWGLVLFLEILEGNTSVRFAVMAGAAFGAMSITRPDGVMLTAALAIISLLYKEVRTKQFRSVAIMVAVAATPVLAVLAFRLSYYHDWVPNSAHVKFNTSSHYVDLGIAYALSGLTSQWPLWVALAVGTWQWFRSSPLHATSTKRAVALYTCVLVAWIAYIIMTGGDIFPGMRNWIPVTMIVAMLSAEFARTFATTKTARINVIVALAVCISAFGVIQWRDTLNEDARLERWEWEGKEVGLYMKSRFGSLKPLLALEPAGAVAYYSELDCLDMFGLSDPYIASHPTSTPGTGFPGHDAVNPGYVVQRKPDIVLVGFPRGKGWRGKWQEWGSLNSKALHVSAEFQEAYQLVEFVAVPSNRLITSLLLRKDSPRIPWESLRRDMLTDGVVIVHPNELTPVAELLQ